MKLAVALVACVAWLFGTASTTHANEPLWSILAPMEAPTLVAEAQEGQTILSVRVRHRQVGILQNDIRGTGIVNSDRVVIPSGTPVYRAAFGRNDQSFSGGRLYEGWCGVVKEDDRDRGYCMLREGSRYMLGILPGNGTFYAPTRLADYGLRPITTPEVRIDDAAQDMLPSITLNYALDAWRPGGLVLERTASISGLSFRLGSIFLGRADDGSATLLIGQQPFVFTSTDNGEGAAVAAGP